MVNVEQYGSNTYYINDLPNDHPLERYELIELLRQAVDAGIDPREFLSSNDLDLLVEEQASLF